MKRDPALHSLSHDHQHVLANAHRLRGVATSIDIEQLWAEFITFVERELWPHIACEEQVLFPFLIAQDALSGDVHTRLLREHSEIAAAVAALIADQANVQLAHSVGERLHDHVRYEERSVFEHAQSVLSSAQLEQLATRLGDAQGEA
jgi:hemerythrin-like domain-containing protein